MVSKVPIIQKSILITVEYFLFHDFGQLQMIMLSPLEESDNTQLEIHEVKFTKTFEYDYFLLRKIENITKIYHNTFHAISILTRNTYLHQQL